MSRPVVLCYHAISSTWPHGLAVPSGQLSSQLAALRARGYRPAPLEAMLDGAARTYHVTFDDAYRSVADAVPVLRRAGALATVFACTAHADADGAPLTVPELAGEAERFPGELDTLDWDGLRALEAEGIRVESHTVSHPHLTRLADRELARELTDARARLEEALGRRCAYLAYPYGEHDARVERAAQAAGYSAAFALRGDPRNRFALPRLDVYRKDGRLRFAAKLLLRPSERGGDQGVARRERERA